ncbi:MAG: thiol:disulfide interchange protein DsbG [Burkholderiaceae bacterium]|nr:MAG: thiol:disulfide interchange protein DsbG [Burkholderiaceae bacterium]
MAVTGAVCLAASFGLWAQETLGPAEQHLVDSGSKITRRFTSASGLTAIVADNGKEQRLFYVTPDGKNIILGAVFDAAGHNLTAQDLASAVGRSSGPSASAGEAASEPDARPLFERATKAQWIAEGSGGRVVYAIFDPNCMYCHQLHSALRQAVDEGRVQVRWIPVSILAASGSGKIAAIYGASNPSNAIGQAFDNMLPATALTKPVEQAIARNILLLRDTGFTGVPVLLYREGNQVVMHKGMPEAQTIASLGQ